MSNEVWRQTTLNEIEIKEIVDIPKKDNQTGEKFITLSFLVERGKPFECEITDVKYVIIKKDDDEKKKIKLYVKNDEYPNASVILNYSAMNKLLNEFGNEKKKWIGKKIILKTGLIKTNYGINSGIVIETAYSQPTI